MTGCAGVGVQIPVNQPAPTLVTSTATSLSIAWEPPTDCCGVITSYSVRYRPMATNTQWTSVAVGNVLSWTVMGLTPAAQYQFVITATNAAGTSSWSPGLFIY